MDEMVWIDELAPLTAGQLQALKDTAGVNAVIARNVAAAKARALRQVALDTDRSKLRACRKQNAHGGTISGDRELAKLHTPRQQRKLMKMLRRADKGVQS